MKHFPLYIIILFLFSCSSTKKYANSNELCGFDSDIFKISEKDKKINIVVFEKIKTYNKDFIIEKNSSIIVTIKKRKSMVVFAKDDNRKPFEKINYLKKIDYLNKNIRKYLTYNTNGLLMDSKFTSIDPFYNEIGFHIDYNENGEIKKIINNEEGYDICFHEALAIAKEVGKKEIKKYNVKDFSITRVSVKKFPSEKPIWIIGFIRDRELELPNEKNCNKYKEIPYFYNTKYCKIDGKTGDVLSFSFSPCAKIK